VSEPHFQPTSIESASYVCTDNKRARIRPTFDSWDITVGAVHQGHDPEYRPSAALKSRTMRRHQYDETIDLLLRRVLDMGPRSERAGGKNTT
jgi:hypothetical protein